MSELTDKRLAAIRERVVNVVDFGAVADRAVLLAEVEQLRADLVWHRENVRPPEDPNNPRTIASVFVELEVDDKLLESHRRLVQMFDCPRHGECIPFATEEVERLRAELAEAKKILAACAVRIVSSDATISDLMGALNTVAGEPRSRELEMEPRDGQ